MHDDAHHRRTRKETECGPAPPFCMRQRAVLRAEIKQEARTRAALENHGAELLAAAGFDPGAGEDLKPLLDQIALEANCRDLPDPLLDDKPPQLTFIIATCDDDGDQQLAAR